MTQDRQKFAGSLPPDIPRIGQIIASKYQIEHVLGAGGMGVVVAARHLHLAQRVAIKFMRSEAVADATAVERFLREAQAAAVLSSEHVAKVFDVGTLPSGAPYTVMEYLEGVDLGELLEREGPMPVPAAIGFVLQACEAIAEAHAHGIVHRDLKPANLFLTRRMEGSPLVKVLDFGISKALQPGGGEDGSALTASGVVMGSPGYMSPEQVRSAKAVDARSDIWSLGVILYELLTGLSPFIGETLGDTFVKIVSEDPPPLRERRPDVPAALAKAVERCLRRTLAERCASVGELASALEPFAPKEAAVSVDRILRLSGGGPAAISPPDSRGPERLAAARERSDSRPRVPSRPGTRVETSTPWLRSSTAPIETRARGRWTIASVVGAIVLAVTAFGVYTRSGLRREGRDGFEGSSIASAVADPAAQAPEPKPSAGEHAMASSPERQEPGATALPPSAPDHAPTPPERPSRASRLDFPPAIIGSARAPDAGRPTAPHPLRPSGATPSPKAAPAKTDATKPANAAPASSAAPPNEKDIY